MEYTLEEITKKVEDKMQQYDATKTEEELALIAAYMAANVATFFLGDGTYTYNEETGTVFFTEKE